MKMFQISDKLGEVSRIGIGCMRITGLPDEKAVRALIEGSMELGINFLTTRIFTRAVRQKQYLAMP